MAQTLCAILPFSCRLTLRVAGNFNCPSFLGGGEEKIKAVFTSGHVAAFAAPERVFCSCGFCRKNEDKETNAMLLRPGGRIGIGPGRCLTVSHSSGIGQLNEEEEIGGNAMQLRPGSRIGKGRLSPRENPDKSK
jgi:hypothetical protein